MHGVVSHLARRGVEMGTSMHKEYQNFEYQMPVYGIMIIVSTAILYLVGMTLIEYTFGRMIPALIMVESPQALLFEPIKNDPDAALDSKVEQELLLVKQEPITSSFGRTLKHLRANAGRFSRFRGIRIFFVYNAAMTMCTSFITSLPIIPSVIAPVLASLVLANVSMAWTHIVISENSNKPWYKRVPSLKVWKKVAGPTAFLAIAEQLTILIPVGMAVVFGFHEMNHKAAKELSSSEKQVLILKAFSIFAVSIFMALFVVIPANVALTRVQASLLSDDQETIVPFDRSFSGKVVPEIVGGTGVVGVRDALTTFDFSSRLRLIKAYVKVFFMQTALSVFFFFVVIAQIILIVGLDNLRKIGQSQANKGSSDEITIY